MKKKRYIEIRKHDYSGIGFSLLFILIALSSTVTFMFTPRLGEEYHSMMYLLVLCTLSTFLLGLTFLLLSLDRIKVKVEIKESE